MAAQVMCPKCKRRMRAHCRDWWCRWAFCAYCGIALSLKTGKWIGKSNEHGWTR